MRSEEFVVHAAFEWLKRFKRDGVVFFHPLPRGQATLVSSEPTCIPSATEHLNDVDVAFARGKDDELERR